MKITNLIKELELMSDIHGEIEVCVLDKEFCDVRCEVNFKLEPGNILELSAGDILRSLWGERYGKVL